LTQALEIPSEPRPRTVQSGARSGVVLAVASGVSIVANYAFLLAAGRMLGSTDYGSLAALLGLLSVVLLPAGALQYAVSREISQRLASDGEASAARFARATMRLAVIATGPLLLLALALAAPLEALLNIGSVGVVLLASLTLATALVFPVATGVVQGQQRFQALAALYVAPFVLRLLVLAMTAAAGYRLGGAVFATFLGSVGATAAAAALVRRPLHEGATGTPPALGTFLRYLGLVAVGVIGVSLLTNLDILVVKARFPGDAAGAYAAASAFARVGFFLPATILAVLFPRTAARQARGEQTEDILGRSLLATAAFCGLLALLYAAAGVGLVVATYGVDFAPGGEVLAPFALAAGLYSLANILVGYHLSRGESRYAWIVGAAVVVQLVVLSLVPATLHAVVYANLAVAGGLLVAHELFVESSVPALRAGWRHVEHALARVRPAVPEAIAVLVGTTVFVCALFWPFVRHFRSTIAGTPGSDATATVATIWELKHEGGYHLLGITHHTLSGAPFGWDSTNALNMQTFLAYYPTYLLAKLFGAITAFNLTTLAGYILSGATMYLLVRYLGCGRLVAAWAALVYIVFPWHLARIEHASLLQLEVLALLVLTLVAAARRPTWLRVAVVGAANLVCWLMSGYFGPMALVSTIAFMTGVALTSRRRRALFLVGGSGLAAFAAAGIFGIAAAASGTNSGAGLERAVGDLSIFGLRPTELVVPAAHNIVLGTRLDHFWVTHAHGANRTEITNYLGLLTIALAITWLVVAYRRRADLDDRQRTATAGLVATFVAALLFAAPSPIVLAGHQVPMPSRLLWAFVPAFRVIARWDVVLMTALLALAALGLQALVDRTAVRNRLLPAAVVGAAMVISFLELTIHPAEYRFRTVPVPPEYSAVDRTPPGALAEYPLGYSDIYRLWQSRHGRPILNGAPVNTEADAARFVLLDPAQPGTAETLALLGVTAIAIHPGAHVDAEVPPTDPGGVAGYRLVGRFSDGASVWQVTAAPAPALVMLAGGFAAPKRLADGSVGYAFNSSSGVGALNLAAPKAGVVELVFDATPPAGKQRTLRIADSKTEQAFPLSGRTRISVLVEVPRGQSQLLVKTDPAPTSDADSIVVSAPRTQPGSGSAALHADPISPDPGF
jgi:O-antigen/teichoic acid export membrane protein